MSAFKCDWWLRGSLLQADCGWRCSNLEYPESRSRTLPGSCSSGAPTCGRFSLISNNVFLAVSWSVLAATLQFLSVIRLNAVGDRSNKCFLPSKSPKISLRNLFRLTAVKHPKFGGLRAYTFQAPGKQGLWVWTVNRPTEEFTRDIVYSLKF